MIPVDSIREIIAPYEFGVLGLILKSTEIYYDPQRKKIAISKVYPKQLYARMGECIELANDAFYEIRNLHPELFIYRAKVASERDLGTGATAPWFVLLVSETNLLGENACLTDRLLVNEALNIDPILVHPTSKKVIPFSESGLIPLELYSHNYERKVPANVILTEFVETPFSLISDGTLVHLGTKTAMSLYLNFQSPDGTSEDFELDSKDLDVRVQGESRLISGIEALREMEWIRPYYPISEQWK